MHTAMLLDPDAAAQKSETQNVHWRTVWECVSRGLYRNTQIYMCLQINRLGSYNRQWRI